MSHRGVALLPSPYPFHPPSPHHHLTLLGVTVVVALVLDLVEEETLLVFLAFEFDWGGVAKR